MMILSGKFTAIILTLILIWLMLVTVNPIKPGRLKENFYVCDISNISSWREIQGKIKQILSLKTSEDKSKDYIEFTYGNSPDNPYFSCRFKIPEKALFKAESINVRYKISQAAELNIGIHRVGQGPAWSPVSVNEDSVNKIITSSWQINKTVGNEPKLNWLSGPYEEVTFGLKSYDRAKPLIFTIYEVYLN